MYVLSETVFFLYPDMLFAPSIQKINVIYFCLEGQLYYNEKEKKMQFLFTQNILQ